MIKNVLIVCTSAKDRSPSLVNYLGEVFPNYEYRCAGINKYFCEKKGTHLISKEDIAWADLIVLAEDVHLSVVKERFSGETTITSSGNTISGVIRFRWFDNDGKFEKYLKFAVLNCGNYQQGCIGEDYLTKAEMVLSEILERT